MHPNIKRMIKGMKPPKRAKEAWFLYVLQCGNGAFYTGITKDIDQRVAKHNAGKAAKYTRMHGPVELLYQEKCRDRTAAMVRECAVKALTRKQKEELVFKPIPPKRKKRVARRISAKNKTISS